MTTTQEATRGPWRRELDAYARAFAGAFIFGIPLLFTMEMWWIGEYADRGKLLAFLAIALIANFGLNYVSGFRREWTLAATIEETIEVVAVGVVAAAGMLLVLNRIGPGDPLDSVLGMIAIQAVPLSIGASVANEVFRRDPERGRAGDPGDDELPAWQELLSDVGGTIIGGIFIGFSIAPTEEVRMLAAGLDYPHLVIVVAFTLLISYGIVFASGFDAAQPEGPFQDPVTETTLAYAVSLAVAFVTLYLFDQIALSDPLLSTVEQVIVLAVPTTVGGAAGRLVV